MFNASQLGTGSTKHTTRPDVVILEHDHTGQIVAMCVDAPDEHAVLLYESESGRGLACTSNSAVVPHVPRKIFDSLRSDEDTP